MQRNKHIEDNKVIEIYSISDIKNIIKDYFPGGAAIYTVLDYAVCFGSYEYGEFSIGLGKEKNTTTLDWKYLQELRVFNKEKELLVLPAKEGWTKRLLEQCPGADRYVIEEYQKLWGKIKKDGQQGIPGWSLLVSERGSCIQIPWNMYDMKEDQVEQTEVQQKEQMEDQEVAIKVRRYMRVPDIKKNPELVYQTDICMVEFCLWKEGGEICE